MALKAPTIPKELEDKGYTVADETIIKNDGIVQVEIGDSKEPTQFIPQIKKSFNNNEANYSLRDTDNEDATVVVEGEVTKYIRQGWETHIYEKPEAGESGGWEFEWLFHSKPTQIQASLRSKNLQFFKQLPLDQEIIPEEGEVVTETEHYSKDGILLKKRDEDIVNSYVVYYKNKKNNYAGGENYGTGQVGVIKRIKAIDANGDWTWLDMNIDPAGEEQNTLLHVEVSDWFDTAAYPVRVDPILGATTIGGSDLYVGTGDHFYGYKVTADATGYIPVITAYLKYVSTPASPNVKAVILESDKSVAGVGDTATTTADYAWYHIPFSTPVSITNTNDYFVGLVVETGFVYSRANTVTDAGWNDTSNSYTTPASASDGSATNNAMTIFATYTTTANTYIFYTSEGADQLEVKSGINANSATASLNDLVTQATADTVTTDPSNFYVMVAPGTSTDTYHQIRRSILTFDTSFLSGETVTGGNLVVNVISKVASAGDPTDGDLHIVSVSPADVTSIVAGDYDAFGSTSGGELTIADAPSSGGATLALNATGYGLINTTGDTSLGLRVEGDMENSMTWVTYSLIGFRLRGTKEGITSDVRYWPYLEVTVSAATPVTVTPATITGTFSIPTPTITAAQSVSVSPSVLTSTFSIPAHSAGGVTLVSPGVIDATLTIPAPTVSAVQTVNVSADVLTTTLSIPTPTVGEGVSVSPGVITSTLTIPAPTVSTVINVSTAPAAITSTFTIPAPSISAGGNISIAPFAITGTFSIPTPTIGVETAVSPSVLTNTFTLPAPTVSTTRYVTVSPSTFMQTFTIPTPVVTSNEKWYSETTSNWYTKLDL